MSEYTHLLQAGIQDRQQEIHRIAEILGKHAFNQGRRAALAEVITIVLGSLGATQGGAAKFFGDANVGVLSAYALLGLLITAVSGQRSAVSGLEAAFKTETRSAGLRALAAQCQSTIWQIGSAWQKTVGTSEEGERVLAARLLLDQQDTCLAETQSKAADLGVNITLEVRELYEGVPPAMA